MSRDFTPRDFEGPAQESSRSRDPSPVNDIRRKEVHRSGLSRANEPPRERSERPPQTFPPSDGRTILYDRDRGYDLSASEVRTIADLGKFRVVAAHDLWQHLYSSPREEAEKSIASLIRQGLVQKGSFDGPEATPRELLTLTKRGQRLLRANRLVPKEQAVYCGFVKPKEANHDADLYRMYQEEAARIQEKGGGHLRVILDFELRKKINRDIAKFGAEARPEIAKRHGLEVVRNKIPLPDVQIEYQTRDGELARSNLELVTEHYRGRHVADKARAGFSLYTPHGEGDRLRRVLDHQELTAEILSL